MEASKLDRFPYLFADHVLAHEERLFNGFMQLLDGDVDEVVRISEGAGLTRQVLRLAPRCVIKG